jgi:hypothetical protein
MLSNSFRRVMIFVAAERIGFAFSINTSNPGGSPFSDNLIRITIWQNHRPYD